MKFWDVLSCFISLLLVTNHQTCVLPYSFSGSRETMGTAQLGPLLRALKGSNQRGKPCWPGCIWRHKWGK